eukprot:PITA_02517
MVSVDSWEYPTDFLIINLKTRLDGHLFILGRPWLATADAYIGCRQGNMIITRGTYIKNLVLYPPAQPSVTIVKTNRHPVSYLTDNIRSPLSIQEALEFKDQTEDDAVNNFISQTELTSHTQCHMIKATFDNELKENPLKDTHDHTIPVTFVVNSKIVEIELGKTLNINANLTSEQETKLIHMLRKYKEAFAWDYPDMKGIDPQLCTHNIYIERDARPIRQPQRRLNPHLKEVVKAELQKLLDVNFIYPISDSKWVSPLVVVPKKNGKWRICVDYRELNKATQKDHFPLPFIDQVLDTLAGKKFFFFLDGFSGYNQMQIAPEDQDKTTFTCPWGTFVYRVLPFGLCNAPATLQRAILSIFVELINEGLEVYMDDFTPYGDEFDPALDTLEKVLQRCIATRLCSSHEKCYMMMTEGLILGHYISAAGIQVDPAKIQILLIIPTPTTQTEEFDITIKDRPGKENLVADFLSRMPKLVDAATVEDQFLDEHLFVVVVQTPWYADVANYLAVEYVTKWVEAEALPRATEDSVIQFLFHLFVRYGLPREIITDGGPQFAGNKIDATLNNYHVQHKITTPYHPQANGLVESSNKIIETILMKTVASHRCDWVSRLLEALWAYRTTWRITTGYSPYQLVFGKQPIFPIEFEIQTLRTTQEVGLDLTEA